MFAALAWTRLELRPAAACAPVCFAMVNVKLPSFLEPALGLGRAAPTLKKYLEGLQALLEPGPIEPQPT